MKDLLGWIKNKLWELKEEMTNIGPWEVRGPGGAEYDRWYKLRIKFAVMFSQEVEVISMATKNI